VEALDLVSSTGQNLRGRLKIALVDEHLRSTREVERVGAAGVSCCYPRGDPADASRP